MFTLQPKHKFNRLKRTGMEAVRAEMLEKVLPYNFRGLRTLRLQKDACGEKIATGAAQELSSSEGKTRDVA
ncbi:MAG: hypothetical protein WCR33_04235 [Bacilli bacterium]